MVGDTYSWATRNKTELQLLRYVFRVMFLWHLSRLVLTLVDSVELMTAERSSNAAYVRTTFEIVDNNLNVHIPLREDELQIGKTPLRETPYTNVPIHCPFCPLSASGKPHTIWKYNGTSFSIQRTPPPTLSQLMSSLSALGNYPISPPSL